MQLGSANKIGHKCRIGLDQLRKLIRIRILDRKDGYFYSEMAME